MKVAAVTGMEAEARIARQAGIAARASGGVPENTKAIAERFLEEGAELLVSFGIAGALSPALMPGAVLLPSEVIDEAGTRYLSDARAHAQVHQKLLGFAGLIPGNYSILGARESVAKADEKENLFHVKQVVAVDLESHIIAYIATRAAKPFIVLRSIADPANRALPPAAANGLGADGKPALGRVLLSVARDPRQIPALIRLASDTKRALAALSSVLNAKPFEG
jgi:adenosylhomocysteine nucleosidase